MRMETNARKGIMDDYENKETVLFSTKAKYNSEMISTSTNNSQTLKLKETEKIIKKEMYLSPLSKVEIKLDRSPGRDMTLPYKNQNKYKRTVTDYYNLKYFILCLGSISMMSLLLQGVVFLVFDIN